MIRRLGHKFPCLRSLLEPGISPGRLAERVAGRATIEGGREEN